MPLKHDDANMLKYFWEEKGDFQRYSGYQRVVDQVKEEYPLLLSGLDKIREGKHLVEMVIEKIVEESVLDE